MPKLSVIVPCYFNEDNIPVTARELVANEANFPPEVTFEYVFVNDGSGDDTLGALRRAQDQYPGRIRIVATNGAKSEPSQSMVSPANDAGVADRR